MEVMICSWTLGHGLRKCFWSDGNYNMGAFVWLLGGPVSIVNLPV
jgi:hypothetical protein